jgi:hypothetical protein
MPEFLVSCRPYLPDVGLQSVHYVAQGVSLDREQIVENARRRGAVLVIRGRSSSTSDMTQSSRMSLRGSQTWRYFENRAAKLPTH